MKNLGILMALTTILTATSAFAADWTAIECHLATGSKGAGHASVVSSNASIQRANMTKPTDKETVGNLKIQDIDFSFDVSEYLPGSPLLSVSVFLPELGGLVLLGSGDGSSVNIMEAQPGKGSSRSITCSVK